jgi:ABC-type glycerol-3-phosphate transport system substrate-binding protein
MYHQVTDLFAPWIFFLQDHPNMLFSTPVHMVASTGEIRFQSWVSPAIMRNSPNQELAWEFIRFCMEFSENLWHQEPHLSEWDLWHLFPVNRAKFENFLRPYLNFRHWVTVQTDVISVTGDEEIDTRDREARIEYSIYRFAELIEMVNFEVRHNWAVLESLIYPDINLFVTGQQSVQMALANIQSRLELYVAE